MSIGGAEKYLFDLTDALLAQDYEVDIITYQIALEAPPQLANNVVNVQNILGLVSYCIKNRNRFYLTAYGEADLFAASILTRLKYSLVMHQPTLMTFKPDIKQTFLFRKKFQKHLTRTQWIMLNQEYSQYGIIRKIKHEFSALLKFYSAKNAAHRIVWSDYAVNEKIRFMGLVCTKIIGAFFKAELNECLKNIKELKKYDCVVVARLDKNKRLIETINGYAEAKKLQPEISNLIIIGDGPQKEDLKSLVLKLKLENHVTFMGFISRDEVNQFMTEARILIALDWADFRLTMFEALIRGCRVIVSKDAEIDEVLLRNHLVSKTHLDPKLIAKKIKKFYELPTVTTNNLPINFFEKHSWECYVEKLVGMLAK